MTNIEQAFLDAVGQLLEELKDITESKEEYYTVVNGSLTLSLQNELRHALHMDELEVE